GSARRGSRSRGGPSPSTARSCGSLPPRNASSRSDRQSGHGVPMSVECTGRNVEVTAALQELARRRTLRLERHLGGPAVVRVVLSHEKHRFGAEVIASHRRRHWKAQEETSGDPRAAVTLAFEKIDAQAKKDLGRRRDRHRGATGGSHRGDKTVRGEVAES